MPNLFDRVVAEIDEPAVEEPQVEDASVASPAPPAGNLFDRVVAGTEPSEPAPAEGGLEIPVFGPSLKLSDFPTEHQTPEQKRAQEFLFGTLEPSGPLAEPRSQFFTPGPDPAEVAEKASAEEAAKFFGVTPFNIAKWREQGPIGAIENIRATTATEAGEKLPFIGPFFTANRNAQFRKHADVLKSLNTDLKFHRDELEKIEAGTADIPANTTPLEWAGAQIRAHNFLLEAMQDTESAKFVDEYLKKRAELAIRGRSFWAKAGSAVAELPAYMIEFLATGGVYAAGKKIALKAAVKIGAKGAAAKLIGAIGGTLGRVLALSPEFLAKGQERLLPDIQKDASGVFHITETDQSVVGAFLGSFTSQFAELLGEVSGEAMLQIMGRFMPKFATAMAGGKGGVALRKLGFHGPIPELAEERVTQFMQAFANDIGIDTQQPNWLPTLEDLLVEGVVIAIPTAAGAVISAADRRAKKRKVAEPPAKPVEALVTAEAEKPPPTPSEAVEAAPETKERAEAIPEPVTELVTEFPEEVAEAKPEKPEKPAPRAPAAAVGEIGGEVVEKPLAKQDGTELIATIEADKKKPTGALKRTPKQYAELFKEADTEALRELRAWAKDDNVYVRQFLQPVIVAELQRRGGVQRKAEAEERGKAIARKKAAAEEKKPELRKARREQNKAMRGLEDEIVSQYESESGESVETLEAIEEDVEEEAGANFTFSGPLPAEITDQFDVNKDGTPKIPNWVRQIFKWNTGKPGDAGGSEMMSRPGGGVAMVKRAKAIFEGRQGRINASIDAAEKWARTGKDVKDTALLLKIERWRALDAQREGEAEAPTETIKVADLKPGDTFGHLGETFTVEREEGGAVIIKDGEAGHLFDGDTIPIDKGTLKKRKGIFKKSTVDAAKKRFFDPDTFFVNPLMPSRIRDMGIIIIDYVDQGARKLSDVINRILIDQGIKTGTREAKRIAQYVRKAWANTKNARTRIVEIQKSQKKAAKAAARKAFIKARVQEAGKPPVVEEVTLSTRQLLSLVLKKETAAARAAFLAAAKDIVKTHEDLGSFAAGITKDLPISKANTARLIKAATSARTSAEQTRAMAAILAVAETGRRNQIIERIKEPASFHRKIRQQTDYRLEKELDRLFESFTKTATAGTIRRSLAAVAKKVALAKDHPVHSVLARLAEEPSLALNRMDSALLNDLVNVITEISYAEATRNAMLASEKYADAQAAIVQSKEIIEDRHTEKKTGDMTKAGVFRLLKRALLRGPAYRSFLVELIGGQEGPVMEILHKNLRKAESDELAFHDKRLAFFMESLKADGIDVAKLNLRKWAKEEVTVKIGGKSIKTTQGFLAGLLGNLSDSSTRRLLLSEEHQGLSFASNTTVRYKLSESDIPGLENAANATTNAVVKAVMAWYNGPQIKMLNEASRKLQGRDISKRQDRYPRHIDKKFLELEPNRLVREWLNRQAEYAGQFKGREGSLVPLIVDDIITAFEKDTKVAGVYVAKQAVTQDATRMLSDPTFSETVINRVRDGGNLLSRLEQEVRDFHGLTSPDFQAPDRLVRFFYHNFHVAVLGLRAHIGFYQFVSYFSALTDIPFRYWAHRPYFPTKARIAEMSAAHPELAARANASAYSIMSSEDIGNTRKLGTDKTITQVARDASLFHIRYMDMLAIVNIWEALKKEAAAQGFKGDNLIEHAAQRTVDVIDAGQPTWGVGNSSGWALKARRNPWFKALAMFSSQTSKYADRLAKAVLRYSHGEISFAKMAHDVAIVTFLQAAMIHAIQTTMFWVYSGFKPDEDDDKSMWDKSIAFGFGAVRRVLGIWLGVREAAVPLAAEIQAEVTGQKVPYYMDAPLLSWGKSGLSAFKTGADKVSDIFTDQTFLEEQKHGARTVKAIDAAQRFFSVLWGLPTQGPAAIIRKATPDTLKESFNAEKNKLTKKKKAKWLAPLEAQRLAFMTANKTVITRLNANIKLIEAEPLTTKESKRTRQKLILDRIDGIYQRVMTGAQK